MTKITPLERIVGTAAATLPLAASIILDKHFGYALGTGLWGMLILAWVWNLSAQKEAREE
ncbi:hypothetical protein LCGC14_1682750 [marine sediment metagenome]|uniref:Uncharacterized protein n=1 Tax=marine sediment metagenome TaxID=412755 RepID=A0A0F9K3M6_9ZZZZ